MTRKDTAAAMLALKVLRQPGLSQLRTLAMCSIYDRSPEAGSVPVQYFGPSAIYEPVRIYQFGGGLVAVGVDVVRHYLLDLQDGALGDVWFQGERAVLRSDRESLKKGLLLTSNGHHHTPIRNATWQ